MTKLPRRHRWRGFTLLEMLVVVVIIGIMIAGAILSLGATGRDGQLQNESDRLTALIAYVRDRGALMTTEYGIRCGQHGYRFVYFDNLTNQWMPETLDDTLRMRRLPSGLDLQLVIEGRPIDLSDDALKFDDNPAPEAAAATGNPYTAAALANAAGSTGAMAGAALGADTGAGPGSVDGNGNSADPGALNDQVADNTPQIMLLSNGDTNSFVLTIERPSSRRSVTIQSNADGSISTGKIVEAAP